MKEAESVQSISGNIFLPANTLRMVLSVPIARLHNLAITANGNNVYIGGDSVQANLGIPINLNDVISFSWQDFRKEEEGDLKIYGVALVDTSVSFLLWRRD